MAHKRRRSPEATARLLIIIALLLAEESVPAREITRYRFSSTTVRRAGRRSYLTESYLSDLAEELAQLGWILLRISSDQFALLRTDKASSWIQVSTKRLNLDFEELPDEGVVGPAFRTFLEEADHPARTIAQMDDEAIVTVFDSTGELADDEEAED